MQKFRKNYKSVPREDEPEGTVVVLRDGETADELIWRFKKVMAESKILKTLKEKEFYRSPSEKRRDKSRKAEKRRAEAARKEN